MAMSKKHYEAIAAIIKNRKATWTDGEYLSEEAYGFKVGRDETAEDIAYDLSQLFIKDGYPNFDVAKFRKACGFLVSNRMLHDKDMPGARKDDRTWL